MTIILKEDKHIEFKKASNNLPKSFWETYSSFANTDGGTVYLGVNEIKKGIFEYVGVNDPDKIINDLITSLRNNLKISCDLIKDEDIAVLQENNVQIISIRIPEALSSQKPVYINNKINEAYIRTGDADQKINSDELKQFISDANIQVSDSNALNGFGLNDLVIEDINNYKKQYMKFSDESENVNESIEKFLIRIGAMAIDRATGESKINEAGLLFFGKYNSIIEKFPGFQLDYVKKYNALDTNWINRISSGDMNTPEMNIYKYYKVVFDQLKGSIPQAFDQSDDGTQNNYYRNMSIAIREALINLLMHAYYGSNTSISILDTNNYFEFRNPGKMLVSPEEFILGSKSVTRNPRLAILFRRIGLAERAGSGGQRIYEMAEKNSLRKPDIKIGATDTSIIIWKTNLENSMINDLNGIEREVAVLTFKKTMVKFSDYKKAFVNENVTEYKLRNVLEHLQDKQIIQKVGNGKATKYMINIDDLAGKHAYMKAIKSLEINI